jgi:hypothetical protein
MKSPALFRPRTAIHKPVLHQTTRGDSQVDDAKSALDHNENLDMKKADFAMVQESRTHLVD